MDSNDFSHMSCCEQAAPPVVSVTCDHDSTLVILRSTRSARHLLRSINQARLDKTNLYLDVRVLPEANDRSTPAHRALDDDGVGRKVHSYRESLWSAKKRDQETRHTEVETSIRSRPFRNHSSMRCLSLVSRPA